MQITKRAGLALLLLCVANTLSQPLVQNVDDLASASQLIERNKPGLVLFPKRETTVVNGGQTVTVGSGSSSGEVDTGNQSPSSSSGLSEESKIAIGIGVGLGIPSLIATIWVAVLATPAFRRWLNRRRRQNADVSTPDNAFSSKYALSEMQKPETISTGGQSDRWTQKESSRRPETYHKPELAGSAFIRGSNRQPQYNRTTQNMYELSN